MRLWFPGLSSKRLGFLAILLAPALPLVYVALTHRHGVEGVFVPGPLASSHAHLGCKECHVEPWRKGKEVLKSSDHAGELMDRACARCHGGLGQRPGSPAAPLSAFLAVKPSAVGVHNDRQLPQTVGSCASCHREHQGERVRLRATDAHCLRCHANLQTATGTATFHAHVTSFDVDHPPFGHWRKDGLRDRGQLNFNHGAHLNIKAERVRGLAEPVRRLQTESCAFCHEPEPPGRFMLPIRYEKHCAACHPLNLPLLDVGRKHAALPAVVAFNAQPVPHLEPGAVRDSLLSRLSQFALQHPEVLQQPADVIELPFPGKPPRPARPREPRTWVQDQLPGIERVVFDGSCRYCHVEKDPAQRVRSLPRYEATRVATRWFPHAEFNHARHGALSCQECHPSASSSRTSDVLMPPITACVQCHNHRRAARSARADCLECHHYHGPP